ncbi:MAG: dienelactone hydrolase family protein [Chloroflexi bacterium]|nr:dienelactone hydrolase family protein [Chloroflexota bacterium]
MTTIHQGQRIALAGTPLKDAQAVMVMFHGRGAAPESILSLAREFEAPGLAYLAPQAADNSWWPQPFTAPLAANEPHFSSALAAVGEALAHVQQIGIASNKTVLLGFSQGAVLALEYAARSGQRYGGVVGLSGGLFGPQLDAANYPTGLAGTPVFLGCSDVDSHIPRARVEESAAMFRLLGADVTMRLYPGMGHIINADEIAFVQALLRCLLAS